MVERLKHKYALSEQGARDMIRACISVTCTNLAFMMSSGVLYLLIKDLLNDNLTKARIPVYAACCAGVIILIAILNYVQYGATFFTTYRESGVRRTSLAETLRKLPLSYFGKKNIADLTTNIMGDCAQIETASSHWIPELIGAVIGVGLVLVTAFVVVYVGSKAFPVIAQYYASVKNLVDVGALSALLGKGITELVEEMEPSLQEQLGEVPQIIRKQIGKRILELVINWLRERLGFEKNSLYGVALDAFGDLALGGIGGVVEDWSVMPDAAET